ncbi:MAG: hypothetical protein Q9195_002523 [Heterodermia aff. obscurata]
MTRSQAWKEEGRYDKKLSITGELQRITTDKSQLPISQTPNTLAWPLIIHSPKEDLALAPAPRLPPHSHLSSQTMLTLTLLPLLLALALSQLTSASPAPAWNKRQFANSTTTTPFLTSTAAGAVLMPRGTGTGAIIQARATGRPAFEKRQFANSTATASSSGAAAVLVARGTGTEAVLVARGTGTGVPVLF